MRFHSFILSLLLCGTLAAQVPQAFDFQAVARDASGNVLSAQPVSVRLTVHSGAAAGPVVYQETHAVSTNAFGLFSVAVGQGSTVQGVFADVSWGGDAHFLQVELDANGGSNYLDMGTTQLLSVPYALHAGGVDCPTVSLLGDTLKQANGCFVIIPGLSGANGGCLDVDNDGFYNNAGCPPLDCDDSNALVNPGAVETCGNGLDDDCDGAVDNDPDVANHPTWYPDADGDGFGDENATGIVSCAAPGPGLVTNNLDCDDTTPAGNIPGVFCTCNAADRAWVDANQVAYMAFVEAQYQNCLFETSFNISMATICTQEALVQAELEGIIPVSSNCHVCVLARMECMFQNCLSSCLGGNTGACEECIQLNCTPAFVSCLGLVDADSDGWVSGSDCDDTNAAIHPGAAEICDTIDNDCDGQVDEDNVCNPCPDNDGDGFTTCDGDCDDNDEHINPDSTEMCDGVDNDCDGQVDEACTGTECGFFNGTQQGTCDGQDMCINGFCVTCVDNDADGFTTCDGDCDDNNLNINPGATEVCGDGVDNDCDGTVDNMTTWFEDLDGDGFGDPGSTVDACEQPIGFISNGGDCNDQDANVFPLAGPGTGCASCSQADSQWMDDNYLSLWNTTGTAVGECAGLTGQAAWDCLRTHIQPFVPIGATCLQCAVERAFTVLGSCSAQCIPWLLSDGVVAGSVDCNACSIGSGVHTAFAACTGVVDQDGDGVPASVDCNDNDAAFRPGVVDICDGLDNDCDGEVDEGGVCNTCTDNDADGFTTCDGDCDDNNLNINPGASEVCSDGVDNDCDGTVDEGCSECTPGQVEACGSGVGACEPGTRTCNGSGVWGACTGEVLPTTEICDGLDNDCDGQVDEGCSSFCTPVEAAWVDQNQLFLYQQAHSPWVSCFGTPDPDACLVDALIAGGQVPLGTNCLQCLTDRFNCISANCLAQCIALGTDCQSCLDAAGCDVTFLQCMGITDTDGDGWADGSDCDPNDPTIHPNATETCGDGIDSNCNGSQIEGQFLAYPDQDQDGFGAGGETEGVLVCALSGIMVGIGGDCDDTNPSIGPFFTEHVDGLDNDCDGQLMPAEIDGDGDGYIPGTLDGPWFGTPILGDEDCDDTDPNIHPGATELCNNIDDDCDLQVDEGINLVTDVSNCGGCGVVCDDGLPCTQDICSAGSCGIQPGFVAPGYCHILGGCFLEGEVNPAEPCFSCQPGISQTSWTPLPAGTPCDDGNPNTFNDVCDGFGNCSGAPLQNEICDGIDNDGDGLIDGADDSLILPLCENQTGVCNGAQKTSNMCISGTWLTCATSDYAIGSPAYEVTETTCDALDNDCDGQVDEDNVCP